MKQKWTTFTFFSFLYFKENMDRYLRLAIYVHLIVVINGFESDYLFWILVPTSQQNQIACDPSSLPKYPPSKEIDVKMREDQNRR